MIKPATLKKGSKVALLGASGPIRDAIIEPALKAVEELGLVAKVYPSYTARYGYLAGSDAQRAKDLQEAFEDDEIEGILCSRGGYGANRIMPLLNMESIAKHPKPLFGYSDVTALMIALNNAGMEAYHTPMPSTEWHKGLDDYTTSWLKAMLFGTDNGAYCNHSEAAPMKTVFGGQAKGRLCGGNLSLLAASLGTPWELDTKGKILFIEEIGEQPYRIDGFITCLRNAGKLDQCNGIILGAFTDCEATEPEKSLTIDDIVADLLLPLKKPVISGFTCGHCMPTASLPMGREVVLDGDKATFYDA